MRHCAFYRFLWIRIKEETTGTGLSKIREYHEMQSQTTDLMKKRQTNALKISLKTIMVHIKTF
jgi:hypothetical protein